MLTKLSVDQSLMKAKAHKKKGEFLEAEKLYQGVLQTFSKNKRALQGLADLNKNKHKNPTLNLLQEEIDQLIDLYKQGQFSSVVEQAQTLTEQYPESFMIWNILGVSAAQIGMPDQAIAAFKKVISLKPDYAEAYSNMGFALQEQGKLDDAIEAHKKCILLKPDYVNAYNNMGNVLKDQGKTEEAIDAYKKVISLKPDYAEAYSNLGLALQEQAKYDEAIDAYKKSISLKPNYADAYYNMGITLKDQGKFEEAIEAYKKSISFKPDFALAFNNIGNAFLDQGKTDEAIDAYNNSILLRPEYADTHKNLSIAFLQSGRVKEGLDKYEWRWKTEEGLLQKRYFSQPLWDGEKSLNGKRILLWCEQGIGDTMNWSSCLSLITSQAKHCILECQEKLVPLLERSFPNVEVKPVNTNLDFARDDFDCHLPMGNLYKHFFQEILRNPKSDAYLVPDPVRVKFWKERLNHLGKGPYIGFCWKSSVVSAYRVQHYPPISNWFPVLKIPDVTFINLQYNNFEGDLAKVREELGIIVHNFDDLDQHGKIDEVAALSAALDMVVSTKATPPMISAGVGTLTKIANWRQSNFNTFLTNPVSSSLEMFHRDTWETWENVFSLITEEIYKLKNQTI